MKPRARSLNRFRRFGARFDFEPALDGMKGTGFAQRAETGRTRVPMGRRPLRKTGRRNGEADVSFRK
jgi:hypothetical protein